MKVLLKKEYGQKIYKHGRSKVCPRKERSKVVACQLDIIFRGIMLEKLRGNVQHSDRCIRI